jgi:hypothetical protein
VTAASKQERELTECLATENIRPEVRGHILANFPITTLSYNVESAHNAIDPAATVDFRDHPA